MNEIRFGLIVVSDTCHAKTRKDKTSPAIEVALLASFPNARVTGKMITPNEKMSVHKALINLYTTQCNVIFTIGGTGGSPKDVTPEATKAVIDKEVPGMAYAMLSKSLHINDMTLVSRAICGVKGNTLIINLPGDTKRALDCFDFIKAAIPQALAHLTMKKRHHDFQGDIQEPYIVSSKVKVTDLSKRIRFPSEKVSVTGAIFLMFTTCSSYTTTDTVDVQNSLTRILAEDVVSTEPCPPFPTAVVDGYAVKSIDGCGIRTVRKLSAKEERVKMEEASVFSKLTPLCFQLGQRPLANGEVISVSAGEALPFGADAVVQIDDTTLVEVSDDNLKELRVDIKCAPSVGVGVRGVGYDVPSYKPVLSKQDKITAAHIGILSAIGRSKVVVYKRPSVGIVSVGKELQKFDEQLRPGRVFDSTKLMILTLLKQHFFVAYDSGIIEDDPTNVKKALANALSHHDVVIFTGGIHMGEKPVLKEVLVQDFDALIHFENILMIPGFTSFATCRYKDQSKVIFTVPGNHSSATLAMVLLIIPLLRHLENSKQKCVPKVPVLLDKNVHINHSQDYIKMKLERDDEDTVIRCINNEMSGDMSKMDNFVNTSGLVRWMDVKEIPCETCKTCSLRLCDSCKTKVMGTYVDLMLVDVL